MLFSDFGLNVLAGWLSNQIPGVAVLTEEPYEIGKSEVFQNDPVDEKKSKHFRTFDVYYDLEKILPYLVDPIAHIIIEKEPSTSWNLACLVLESKITGEWYVFERGRMAMQGTGGGIRQSEIAFKRLREAKAFIASWVVSKSVLDEFEEGILLWHEVRTKAVPLFSSISTDEDWRFIQERTKELVTMI